MRSADVYCAPHIGGESFGIVLVEAMAAGTAVVASELDAFRRVLVAGFISGGTDDVDANLETVRLLRSQLRTKSGLRVIEADVLPLAELAADKAKAAPASAPAAAPAAPAENGNGLPKVAADVQTAAPPQGPAAPAPQQNASSACRCGSHKFPERPTTLRGCSYIPRYRPI